MTISPESFSLFPSCFQLQTGLISCQTVSYARPEPAPSQPPSGWHAHEPAPKGSAAAQLIGSSPTSGTHGEHTNISASLLSRYLQAVWMAKAWANTKSDTSSMCLTQRHSCHSLPLWSSPAGTSPPQPCMDSAEGKAHLHI